MWCLGTAIETITETWVKKKDPLEEQMTADGNTEERPLETGTGKLEANQVYHGSTTSALESGETETVGSLGLSSQPIEMSQ